MFPNDGWAGEVTPPGRACLNLPFDVTWHPFLSAAGRGRHCARTLYMTTLPLAEVRANLSKLVDEAVRTHQRIEVTRQGRRAAVILSADDYDSIMETLDILSDPALMKELRQGQADIARGDFHTLDDVTKEMRTRGRLPK